MSPEGPVPEQPGPPADQPLNPQAFFHCVPHTASLPHPRGSSCIPRTLPPGWAFTRMDQLPQRGEKTSSTIRAVPLKRPATCRSVSHLEACRGETRDPKSNSLRHDLPQLTRENRFACLPEKLNAYTVTMPDWEWWVPSPPGPGGFTQGILAKPSSWHMSTSVICRPGAGSPGNSFKLTAGGKSWCSSAEARPSPGTPDDNLSRGETPMCFSALQPTTSGRGQEEA